MKEILIFMGIIMGLVSMIVIPVVIFLSKKAEHLKKEIQLKKDKEAETQRISKLYWESKKENKSLSDKDLDIKINEIQEEEMDEYNRTCLKACSEEKLERIKSKRDKDRLHAILKQKDEEAKERNDKISIALKQRDEMIKNLPHINKKEFSNPYTTTSYHYKNDIYSTSSPKEVNRLGDYNNIYSHNTSYGKYGETNSILEKITKIKKDLESQRNRGKGTKVNVLKYPVTKKGISEALCRMDDVLEILDDSVDSLNNDEFSEFEKEFNNMEKEFLLLDEEINNELHGKKNSKPSSSSELSSSSSEDSYESYASSESTFD